MFRPPSRVNITLSDKTYRQILVINVRISIELTNDYFYYEYSLASALYLYTYVCTISM